MPFLSVDGEGRAGGGVTRWGAATSAALPTPSGQLQPTDRQ